MTLVGGPVGDLGVSAAGCGMFVAVASTANTNTKILNCGDMALIDEVM